MAWQWWNRIKKGVQSERGRRILLALLLVVLAIDSAKILRGSSPFRSRSDFEDYYEASKRLHSGEDLYKTDALNHIIIEGSQLKQWTAEDLIRLLAESKGVGAYLYPPFFAFVLTPLRSLDYRTAAIVYQTFSLLILALFLVMFHRYLRDLGRPGYEYSLVVATLLYFSFLDDNASNGNVGFALLFLCGIGVLWAFRRGVLSFVGGFLIDVASVIKIIPAFLSGVLFAGRRYVALAGFVSGVLFSVMLPATTIGWQKNVDVHRQWYSFLMETYQKYFVVRPYANNQTVSAALSKYLLADSDAKQADYGLPLYRLSLADVSAFSMTVRLINLALIGSLGLLVLFFAFRRPVQGEDSDFAGLLSLTLLTALVSSGVSWYHTYALLIVPLALRLTDERPMGGDEKAAFFGPAALALFLSVSPTAVSDAFSLYSVFTLAALLAIVLHHRRAWKGLLGRRPV